MFLSHDAAGLGKSQHVKCIKGSMGCSSSCGTSRSEDCVSNDEQFRAAEDTSCTFESMSPYKEVTWNDTLFGCFLQILHNESISCEPK